MREEIRKYIIRLTPCAAMLILFFIAFFGMAAPVCAAETVEHNVPYIYRTPNGSDDRICPEAIDLSTVSGNTIGEGKWYVVKGTVTKKDRLKIKGTCNLILSPDCRLFCTKGIGCNSGNTLNIYSSDRASQGYINCDISKDNYAAIGGDENHSSGNINIHNGRIYAESNYGGAGIGGGKDGNSGLINIYGGIITAKGGLNAAAIGGGLNGQAGDITIYSGDIDATARGSYWSDNIEYTGHAAAIGSGSDQRQHGTISILDGWVEAKSVNGAGIGSSESNSADQIFISGGAVIASSVNGAGIGGGRYGKGGETIITGGRVVAMSGYRGAGIGGGEKGSGGYVYIDGGKVMATGGQITVDLLEAATYKNYGSSWGAQNPDLNVLIWFFISMYKQGNYGGAGIGGGDGGSGGEVIIAGGDVVANAGDGKSRAIGGGRRKGAGSLDIHDKMFVLAGTKKDDLHPVEASHREDEAGSKPFVRILPCIHPDGYTYTSIDDENHKLSCPYCTENDGLIEPHEFDDYGNCIHCDYGFYTVILIPNNGISGPSKRYYVSKKEKFKVPKCSFTAPAGKIFSHWQVQYMSYERPIFKAYEGDELDPPESDGIALRAQWTKPYPLWVSGIRVTDDNKDDVLGDGGSVVFEPGENKDGTLILNSPPPFKNSHSTSKALIYAEGISLTIEGKGEIKGDGIEPRAAVNIKNGSLTLKTENLEAYGGNSGILVQGGSLRIAEGTQRVYAEGEAGILAHNGITIDQGLSIVNPEHGSAREISIESGIPFYAVCAENSYYPAPEAEITADQRTVTWNPGYEGVDPVTEQAPVGKEITIPSVSDEKIGFTHPDGEAFVGWKKDPSNRAAGDTEIYAPGDTYMIEEDVSFTAQWEKTFPIWVNGIQIKSDNMDDVLEDGTVSYDSGTNTLTLENPQKMDNLHEGAWIYADGIDLTIKGDATINTAALNDSYGIAINKGSLTLKTDHLSVFSNNYGLYIEGESQDDPESLNILSGTLSVESQISTAIYTKNANLLIQDDPGGLTEVSRVIAAGFDAYSINGDFTIGDTLEIIDPENAMIDRDGSNRFVYDKDRNEKASRVEISRREDEPPATYDVIYWITGDIPSDAIVPDPQTGLEAGAQVDVADKPETQETEHDGVPGTYSFEGWTAPEGITVEDGHFTMPESDVTFIGKWTFTPAEYTVAFVDEDGNTPLLPPKTYAYGTPVDKIIKPQEPRKAADDQYIYTFDGWEPPLDEVKADVTYVAKYTAEERSADDESYTVTFDSAGGSPVPSQTVKKGDTAQKPDDPVWEGHTFGTWTLDESAYDFSQPVTDNLNLVAVWDPYQPDDQGDYEVTDETPDHYYEIFQIFTGDYTEMPDDEGEGTHPVLTNIVWGKNGKYPAGSSKGDPVAEDILQDLYDVTEEEMDKDKLKKIEKYVDLRSDPVRTLHIEGTDPVSVPLPSGYYLIRDMNNSQTGRYDAYTIYITVVVKDYTITPKMVKPSVDKQVSDGEESYYETTKEGNATNKNPGVNGFYESADHAINEPFLFRLAVTLPASDRYVDYDEYKLIFHDTLSEGVTFESIKSVKMGTVDLPSSSYTIEGVSEGDAGKEWTLTVTLPKGQDDNYKNLTNGTVVEVIYQAHLNENAAVHNDNVNNDAQTNQNIVYLEYSNNPNVDIHPPEDHKADTGKTEPDSVWVFTYRTDFMKRADDENGPPVAGAGFTLYQGETAVKLTNRGDGSYIVADQTAENGVITEMRSGDDGKFRVIGLDAGSYTLKETSVPGGFTRCSDTDLSIEASHAENDSTSGADLNLHNSKMSCTMVNISGSVLPSTGGPGTRLFRLLGILLVLSAGILLITRRRVEI